MEQFKRALTIKPFSLDHQSGLLEALRVTDARGQNREADRLAQLGQTDETLETGGVFGARTSVVGNRNHVALSIT
jgi:hypothetical protein